MKYSILVVLLVAVLLSCTQQLSIPPEAHPDTSKWNDLFAPDLSNAAYADTVWSITDGVLTAAYDENIWTIDDYDNFILDLEFKTADSTNSGVVVYCSDTEN